MELRNYQERFVTGIASKLSRKRKVVGQLATGGGKTVVFSAISQRYIAKSGKRVLILVHRKELLAQTRRTAYNSFGIICEPIVAGMRYIPPADLYVGMVESVNRRIDKLEGIGLVIIDECHIANFNKIHEHFPDQLIIGFTATPLSSSKKRPLKNYYDDIICGVDIPELIKDGHLCQNITWAPKDTVDRLELAVKNGEFEDHSMALAFSKPRYIHNTVAAYLKWTPKTKALIFNVNIEHSKIVCDEFVKAKIDCRHLDSTMASVERDRILSWFENTPGAVLCNVGIATTGFDVPSIETIIINKATLSMPLWIQMCGRGSRPTPYKSAFTIIDMGGNAIAHGDWCQSRNWTEIFHNPPKPGKPTAAPVKSCPACEAIVPASTKTCPYCGHKWADKEIAIEAELHEFIIVTKNIDVDAVIKANKHRKEYYALFNIGRTLAQEAKKTIPKMTDEYAMYILEHKYYLLARQWTQAQGKRFNKWHQTKCREVLFNELQGFYPKWETELIPKVHKVSDVTLQNISSLQPLTSI